MHKAGYSPLLCGHTPRAGIELRRDGADPIVVPGPVHTSPREVAGPVDVLILAVKATQNDAARPWLTRLCDERTVVAVLQNGVEQVEQVQPHCPSSAVVPAIVWCSAETQPQGWVRLRGEAALVVPTGPAAEQFAGLLRGAGATVDCDPDFTTAAWRKLLVNALAGFMVLSGRRSAMFRRDDVAALSRRYVAECLAVARAEGDAIVFQHGNPTSSYLWRNIMPHLEGLGRLVACDLIGMGASDKLSPSGPDRYSYGEQRDFLFALWDALDLGDHVVLVLHDWGSALGFDWANQHRDRVQGIAFMEAIVTPMTWADWPPAVRGVFQGFRSPQGEPMALEHNIFVERVLPGAILRQLSDEEMNHYRRPFVNGGEDRRPTLSWPRNLPIDGEPAEVVALVNEYRSWLEETDMPKLFINAEPGAIITGRIRDYVRSWPNQTEITVPGVHFVQEDSPEEIGAAIAQFVRRLRSAAGV